MNLTVESIVDGVLRASLGLSLAAIAIGVLSRALKLQSPRLEQWAWGFVLVQGFVITPLVLSIPVPWPQPTPSDTTISRDMSAAKIESVAPTQPNSASGESPVRPTTDFITVSHATYDSTRANVGHDSQKADSRDVLSWYDIVFLTWFSGIILLAGVGGLRYATFIRRIRQIGVLPEEWMNEWNQVCEQMKVVPKIPLLVTELTGPALVRLPTGYRLVVPRLQWEQLSSSQRRSILRHEAAHLQRGDVWTALIARTVGTMHWFNPFAWWAVQRFEAQAELACDRIAAGDEPAIFAEALFKLGSARSLRHFATQAVRSGSLSDRVKRLLSESSGSPRWKRMVVIVVASGALLSTAIRVQGITYTEQNEEPIVAVSNSPPNQEAAQEQPDVDRVRQAKHILQLGTDDLRTAGHITDIAFSRDGKFIAAAPANAPHAIVELFDVATGKTIKRIEYSEEPSGWIQSIDISPDDSKLLWGEIGGYVVIWDLKADRLLYRTHPLDFRVNEVAFSHGGEMFAYTGTNGLVHLRQTDNPANSLKVFETGQRASTSPAAGVGNGMAGASCLVFSRDDTVLIATGAPKAEISFWRIDDSQLVRRIEIGAGEQKFRSPMINHLEVTPDGRYLMSVGIRYVKREETSIKHAAKNVQLCEIRMWDIDTGKEVSHLHGPEDYGNGFASLSSDGGRVAVVDFGRLRIVDAKTAAPLKSISLPGHWGDQPEFSPDGNIVAVPLHNTIGLFDANTGERLHHSARTPVGSVGTAAWSPDGLQVITSHDDGRIRVWDTRTGEVVWNESPAPDLVSGSDYSRARYVRFTHEGARVIAVGNRPHPEKWQHGFVTIIDATDGKLLRDISLGEVVDAALSLDNRVLVAASSNGSWDDTHLCGVNLETGEILYVNPSAEQQAGFGQMEAMRFLPESTTLVTAMGNGDVITFDGMTGNEQYRFIADWRTPEQIQANKPKWPQLWNGSFTSDGRTLVSSSAEYVYIWNVEVGKLKRKIRHPHDHGCIIAVSPDGKIFATSDLQYAGDHGVDTIRLYDVDSGELLMTAEPDHNRAGVLSFSPDGTKLFTGYHRGSATIWDVRR